VHVRPRTKVPRQQLVGAATGLVAPGASLHRWDAVSTDIRRVVFVVEIGADGAVAVTEVVAVFAAHPLPRLAEPVVQDRRVLAAVDRPEKGVVNGLSAQR